jgi:hypothetical protein
MLFGIFANMLLVSIRYKLEQRYPARNNRYVVNDVPISRIFSMRNYLDDKLIGS